MIGKTGYWDYCFNVEDKEKGIGSLQLLVLTFLWSTDKEEKAFQLIKSHHLIHLIKSHHLIHLIKSHNIIHLIKSPHLIHDQISSSYSSNHWSLVIFVTSLSATCETGWSDKTKPFTSSDEIGSLVKKSVSTNPVQ